METDDTLEVVFEQSHYATLPKERGVASAIIDKWYGYKLAKAFRYQGEDPIYKIAATYGPESDLVENIEYMQLFSRTKSKFDFIQKHFSIKPEKHKNGTVKLEAVATNGRGKTNAKEWLLYHTTNSDDGAQCEIKFYALKKERLATKRMIDRVETHIKWLDEHIDNYKAIRGGKATLTETWELQQPLQRVKKWEKTAHMLQFFADEILKNGADKDLIKDHLKDFKEAKQLEKWSSFSVAKENNQKNKPSLEEEKDNPTTLGIDQNPPNDPQYSVVQKTQAVQQQKSVETFYEHGDLSFFDKETANHIDPKELKAGLMELSYRIKAKGKRKVYFFIGTTGAGKSLSILALQGNKVEKIEEDTSDSEDSEEALYQKVNNLPFPSAALRFDIKHVLPKHEAPVLGHGATGETASTLIYYPDPKKEKHEGIAFADTEGFFGKRKATSAGKCLSAVSFFYTVKVNQVGGIVLVISASELEAAKGKGLKDIAHILQQYFAKTVSENRIKQSLLVMITKVHSKSGRDDVLLKFKQCIQLFYQEFYTEPKGILQKGVNKLRKKVQQSTAYKEKVEKALKAQEQNRRLKLFFAMLLKEDVLPDQINDINNFKLNSKRFCFIFPWDAKNVQKILDKKLKKLQPIASSDLCSFDNPVTQFMEKKIQYFSAQFNKDIQPCLALKRKIEALTKQYNQLLSDKDTDTQKWKEQRDEYMSVWQKTTYMLQFFANEILQDGADKDLIKAHLKSYDEATQHFLSGSLNKGNNQKEKPQQKDEHVNITYRDYFQPGAYQHQLNDNQTTDKSVFDID